MKTWLIAGCVVLLGAAALGVDKPSMTPSATWTGYRTGEGAYQYDYSAGPDETIVWYLGDNQTLMRQSYLAGLGVAGATNGIRRG